MSVSIKTTEVLDPYEKAWHVSWRFDTDSRADIGFKIESEALSLGLPGEWTLIATQQKGSDCPVDFHLRWGGCQLAVRDEAKIFATMKLYGDTPVARRIMTGYRTSVSDVASGSVWLGAAKPSLFNRILASAPDQTSWRLQVELTVPDRSFGQQLECFRAASYFSPNTIPYTPSAIRLYFPKHDFELWTTSEVLSKASPYFNTLFQSGFAETVGKSKKRKKQAQPPPSVMADAQDGVTHDDSDDEADEVYSEEGSSHMNTPDDFEYREVVIKSAAYSTYRALLTWLHTIYIDFAPPLYRARGGCQDIRPRRIALSSFLLHNSPVPLPVSTVSVYRLAHFVELAHLKAIALTTYKFQLTKETVLRELVSDAVECYPELRAAALRVAKKHFDYIRTSEAMKEIVETVKTDEALAMRFGRLMGELMSSP